MSQNDYDAIAIRLAKTTFKKWKKDWKAGNPSSNYSNQIEIKGLEFDLDSTIYFNTVQGQRIIGFEVFKTTGADARDIDDDDDYQTPYILIDFGIEESWLPDYWNEIYFILVDIMRHEIEHILQDGIGIGNYVTGKPNEDDSLERLLIQQGYLPQSAYLILPKEIDANLYGIRLESKLRKESMINTINRYLDTRGLDDVERLDVITCWRNRAKKMEGIPEF